MSQHLLRTLRSIPSETDIPGQPDELALTPEGQLVTVERQVRSVAPLGSSTPLGLGRRLFAASPAPQEPAAHRHGPGRRTKQGAGVVFSGLVLGALAILYLPTDHEQEPPRPQPQLPGGNYLPAAVPLSARQGTPALPTSATSAQPTVPAVAPPFPTGPAGGNLP